MREGKDSIDTELMIKRINGQKRYVKKGDNLFGEYYLINSNGELEVHDNEGLIDIYKKYKASQF